MAIPNADKKILAAMAALQNYEGQNGVRSKILGAIAKIRHRLWSVLSASDINRNADIHPTVAFPHPSGVVVHQSAVIEANCMIMQQVTLGQLAEGGAPHVEEGAYIGAGAKILGAVRIGKRARIGANAVVLEDIPVGATAVGIPAKIVRQSGRC
ncbi:MAG: serine acetyltransferase [Pseudomonadota bacterium]